MVTTSPVETPSADTRGAGQLPDNPAAKHSHSTMAAATPRAEAETEAKLAVPATSVKPRAAIEPVGVGLVGVLVPTTRGREPHT